MVQKLNHLAAALSPSPFHTFNAFLLIYKRIAIECMFEIVSAVYYFTITIYVE